MLKYLNETLWYTIVDIGKEIFSRFVFSFGYTLILIFRTILIYITNQKVENSPHSSDLLNNIYNHIPTSLISCRLWNIKKFSQMSILILCWNYWYWVRIYWYPCKWPNLLNFRQGAIGVITCISIYMLRPTLLPETAVNSWTNLKGMKAYIYICVCDIRNYLRLCSELDSALQKCIWFLCNYCRPYAENFNNLMISIRVCNTYTLFWPNICTLT